MSLATLFRKQDLAIPVGDSLKMNFHKAAQELPQLQLQELVDIPPGLTNDEQIAYLNKYLAGLKNDEPTVTPDDKSPDNLEKEKYIAQLKVKERQIQTQIEQKKELQRQLDEQKALNEKMTKDKAALELENKRLALLSRKYQLIHAITERTKDLNKLKVAEAEEKKIKDAEEKEKRLIAQNNQRIADDKRRQEQEAKKAYEDSIQRKICAIDPTHAGCSSYQMLI